MRCSKPYCKNEAVAGKKCCTVCVDRSKSYARRHKETMGTLSAKCDCGATKRLVDEACSACDEMDGRGAIGSIVSALRALGGSATMAALVEEMGIEERNVYRSIALAKQDGRLRQVQQWDDMMAFGNTKNMNEAKKPKTAYQENHRRSAYGAALGAPCLFVLIDKKVAS